MDNKKEHLQDLLNRLEDRSIRPGLVLPKGVKFRSDLTVAHVAREEIKNIKDEAYIPVFKELLLKEKVTINKINLIRALVRLAHKLKRHDIADYVLGLVKKEKTRWVNDVALSTLNESSLEIDNEKEILFDLAKHKDWQIRFNALGLLSKLPKSYHDRVETLCLNQVQKYKSKPPSLRVIASTLSNVGSVKSIPILKEIVSTSKKSDTVLSAIRAIYHINGKNELEYFIETYNLKKDSYVKRNLILLIAQLGDNEQKEIMVKRAKSLLSRKRTTKWVYTSGTEPELVSIIKFLDQHAKVESDKLLKWIKEKKQNFLDKTELKWINERMGIE